MTVTGTLNGAAQPSTWRFEYHFTSSYTGNTVFQRTAEREAPPTSDDQAVSADLNASFAG